MKIPDPIKKAFTAAGKIGAAGILGAGILLSGSVAGAPSASADTFRHYDVNGQHFTEQVANYCGSRHGDHFSKTLRRGNEMWRTKYYQCAPGDAMNWWPTVDRGTGQVLSLPEGGGSHGTMHTFG
jgi:hypothetical protein